MRQVNADGTVTVTTRLAMASQALAQLVEEYYNQAQNVSITLITFSDSATVVNPARRTRQGRRGRGHPRHQRQRRHQLQGARTAAQSAFGTVDPNVQQRRLLPVRRRAVGRRHSCPGHQHRLRHLRQQQRHRLVRRRHRHRHRDHRTAERHPQHRRQRRRRRRRDHRAGPERLGSALLSTVPVAYGGNVVSSSADGNVLGADGGYIQTVTVRLDSNGDGTSRHRRDVHARSAANTISRSGGFPTGFPISGDMLTLNAARGFGLGTLTFNFSTGDYTYFTGGTASEGDSFSFSFVARDGDGDITPPSTLTVEIADGHPVARPDSDTLLANQTRMEGNVITGLGTDGGLASGQLTNFAPKVPASTTRSTARRSAASPSRAGLQPGPTPRARARGFS